MPTLAQALQSRPDPSAPYLANVVSATTVTVTTDAGVLPNATGVTPSGGQVVVLNVAGRDLAVGWIRP